MRYYALTLLCALLSVYAFRDWFKSLCGLILLMAVVQHPDFPTSIGGIQGANPWNLTLLFIILGWAAARRSEGLTWDMPHHVLILLFLYALVIVVGFIRMYFDRENVVEGSAAYMVSEYIINCFKWAIPGLLLYDGCRSRPRFRLALGCTLAVYFLLALQVIRWMPASAIASGSNLNQTALKIIANEIGFNPVNMSMMLSGASWAMIAVLPLATRRWQQLVLIAAFCVTSYGQALTGGRMGYVTWGIVGLILCAVRWRKGLLLAPIVVIAIAIAAPGVRERMLQGFGETGGSGESYTDDNKVTSGRTIIWPYVIEEIWKSPVIGHGRLAMERTGVAQRLMDELQESFPHPHNAYLECLLDNGIIGLALILPFYLMVLYKSIRLFLAHGHPTFRVAGGVCLALVLALLVAGMGSQTFYPREGAVGMWAAIGIMLRTYELWKMQAVAPQTAPLAMEIPSGASLSL